MATRRDFLRLFPVGAAVALTGRPMPVRASLVHPEPRLGIDGSGVLTRENLAAFPEEILILYDMVRTIPHIADGIGCACGCAALPGYRSLLTCYSQGGMAMGCAICQGEARLAYRRHEAGDDLEQIRRAIDARFG